MTDRFEEERRELVEWEARARIGPSFGTRRYPRVRARKGRAGLFVILDTRRTKRAAFRAARRLRDREGERRPLVVFPLRKAPHRKTHDWAVGARPR